MTKINPLELFENLNKADELNIKSLLLKIQKSDGTEGSLLPAKVKIAWFRHICPKGRLQDEILRLDNEIAVAKCSVFDEDGHHLADGFGEAYFSKESVYGENYISCAETKARSRALSAAGFGCQFPDEVEMIPGMTSNDDPLRDNQKVENLLDDVTPASVTNEQALEKAQQQFEKEVEAAMKTMDPKFSKTFLINFGEHEGQVVEDVYRKEKNADKLFTIKKYAYPETVSLNESVINVAAACRVFIDAWERGTKQKSKK